jgi:hypothetical protein
MLRLSNEILYRVLSLLYFVDRDFCVFGHKKDLLATRLVCSQLASIGQQLAFEHVTLIQDKYGFQRILNISKDPVLCKSVRSITGYFKNFDNEIAALAEKFITSQLIGRTGYNASVPRQMYENYIRDCKHQDQLQHRNLDVAFLAASLPRFHRLDGIKIGQYAGDPLRSFELDEFSCFSGTLVGQRLFESLVSALSIANLKVEDLLICCYDSIYYSSLSFIQGLSPQKLDLYQGAFGTLKRLGLVFSSFSFTEEDDEEFNTAGMLALIKSAPLLEELEMDFPGIGILQSNFLASLEAPKLRGFKLFSAFIEDAASMVRLFEKHAATLRRLEFRSLSLQCGTMETICFGIREFLILESISFEGEFSWYEPDKLGSGTMIIQSTLLAGTVKEFAQRRTDVNPFQ